MSKAKSEKPVVLTQEAFQTIIDGLKVPRRNVSLDDIGALLVAFVNAFKEQLPRAEDATKTKTTKGGLSKSHTTWVSATHTNATAACKNDEWVKYIASIKITNNEDLKPYAKDGKASTTANNNYAQYLGMLQNSDVDKTSPEFYRILGTVLLKSKTHHEAVEAKAKAIHKKLLDESNATKKDVADESEEDDETEKKKPAKKSTKAIKPVTKKADSDDEDAKEESAEESAEEQEKTVKKPAKKPAKKSKKDSGEEST